MEEEKKQAEEAQRKDNLVFKVLQQFPDMDVQSVMIMLEDKNWNFDLVVKELNEAKARAQQQEREQE